jgi:hypothetical protein|nr:DNA/RNA non-specific endonuclease [uncultured Acetatifactor sp.]
MIKRLSALLLAVVLLISLPCTATACNEQCNTYVTQILFGDSALNYASDDSVKMLLDALYLCSEQSDGLGQDKLDFLKSKKVNKIPSLSSLNIKSNYLLECSHNSWESESATTKKAQSVRKKLLQRTVNKVFDFGLFNNWFGSNSGKCNSFAALLYYLHILSDYIADNPVNTEVAFEGFTVSAYAGQPFVLLNGNRPLFTAEEKKSTDGFTSFSPLDSQGRCGVAFANICIDIMPPPDSRQALGSIKPSGWKQNNYPGIVNSELPYLYNRCHLIAHQLAGIDDEINLITGTNYLNAKGMKPFEDKVAKYIRETGNHVLYRVTPVFIGENNVASGVQLEGYSVEDAGEGICFNVYCYNVQPGISLNYANGSNSISDSTFEAENIIPFAVMNADDGNPDLILELNRHLAIIFENQKNTNTYIAMLNKIDSIASESRMIAGNKNTPTQNYIMLKEQQYKYFNVLKCYIPLLLAKEDFFKATFSV